MQKYVIALYIRLSLEDYKYDSMSIENQHLALNEFVSSMPESAHAEILEFIDNGYSGTNFERPKVQELIEMVRANKIDCIIVKDFSRFGRNSIETGYFIERVFPLFHTRFISINDDFDSDQHKGDTGGMDVAFKYLISEYYSRDMSIKTKSAKYAKMQRGEYQSKVCPYGYRKSADGRMEPNPETAAVVQLIFQLAATGIGAAAVTRELFKRGIPTPGEYKATHGQQYHDVSRSRGRWSSSTVLRILEDERYIGSYVIGRRAVIEVGGTRSRRKDREKWFIMTEDWANVLLRISAVAAQCAFSHCGSRIFLQPLVKPLTESHVTGFGQLRALVCANELVELSRHFLLRGTVCVAEDGISIIFMAHNDTGLPAPAFQFSYHAVAGWSSLCHGFHLQSDFVFN